jgi:hypothetical protein
MTRRTITIDEAKRREAEQRAAKAKPRRTNSGTHHDDEGRSLPLTFLDDMEGTRAVDRLVKGILGEGLLAVAYGQPGSGKSFLVLDLALHVALGTDWFGRKVRRGAVLYVAAEGGGGWYNRAAAFCKHHGVDRRRTPFAFILVPVNLGPLGGDAASIIKAAEKLKDRSQEEVVLIVIDTLARAMAGGNENDAVDMGRFVAHCDDIRRATEATVLIVHHTGKNAAAGARGHSTLLGAIDVELEIESNDTGRLIRLTKVRDGNSGRELGFKLVPKTVGQDEDGDDITSCIVEASDIISAKAKQVKVTPGLRALKTTVEIAVHDAGQQVRLPNSGPTVRAVSIEALRPVYYNKRADLTEASKRTIFARDLADAIKRELLVSGVIEGTPMVWLP